MFRKRRYNVQLDCLQGLLADSWGLSGPWAQHRAPLQLLSQGMTGTGNAVEAAELVLPLFSTWRTTKARNCFWFMLRSRVGPAWPVVSMSVRSSVVNTWALSSWSLVLRNQKNSQYQTHAKNLKSIPVIDKRLALPGKWVIALYFIHRITVLG